MKSFLVAAFVMAIAAPSDGFMAPKIQIAPAPAPVTGGYHSPKTILVFLDGTNNQWDSRTNVRRLFEMVGVREDPATLCYYSDGVVAKAAVVGRMSGLVMGLGMKARVMSAYSFLSQHYHEGDRVAIFGFSRGALQARTLAGLISYAGLLCPTKADSEEALDRVWSRIRRIEDSVVTPDDWHDAIGQRRPLVQFLPEMQGVDFPHTRWVEINFLGVWDTVPGSQFKKYGPYGELEDGKPGTRYKLGSYPTIRYIAHAMSLDERRSQFYPVKIAQPLCGFPVPVVNQVWFAGAHADVGGGYADSSSLSGVSLNWMIDLLNESTLLAKPLEHVHADPLGPQHQSLDDCPGNLGSYDMDRTRLYRNELLHPSVAIREEADGVLVRRRGVFCCPEKYQFPQPATPKK